jgi:hypothetical protein
VLLLLIIISVTIINNIINVTIIINIISVTGPVDTSFRVRSEHPDLYLYTYLKYNSCYYF